jgi:hypothetical protein
MSATLRVDGPDFARLLNALKEADKQAATRIRRELREVGKEAARSAQDKVREDPVPDAPGSVGTREAIARGIKVQVRTGATAQGVRISASSANLPQERKRMMRLYNKEAGWRHPVFARTKSAGGWRGLLGAREAVWVHQKGNPYFGSVIEKHRPQAEAALKRAMDEAHRLIVKHD